jgi:hypothetical protein
MTPTALNALIRRVTARHALLSKLPPLYSTRHAFSIGKRSVTIHGTPDSGWHALVASVTDADYRRACREIDTSFNIPDELSVVRCRRKNSNSAMDLADYLETVKRTEWTDQFREAVWGAVFLFDTVDEGVDGPNRPSNAATEHYEAAMKRVCVENKWHRRIAWVRAYPAEFRETCRAVFNYRSIVAGGTLLVTENPDRICPGLSALEKSRWVHAARVVADQWRRDYADQNTYFVIGVDSDYVTDPYRRDGGGYIHEVSWSEHTFMELVYTLLGDDADAGVDFRRFALRSIRADERCGDCPQMRQQIDEKIVRAEWAGSELPFKSDVQARVFAKLTGPAELASSSRRPGPDPLSSLMGQLRDARARISPRYGLLALGKLAESTPHDHSFAIDMRGLRGATRAAAQSRLALMPKWVGAAVNLWAKTGWLVRSPTGLLDLWDHAANADGPNDLSDAGMDPVVVTKSLCDFGVIRQMSNGDYEMAAGYYLSSGTPE